MSIQTQYVQARALSEFLLIQAEVQSPVAQEVAARHADEAFARLAAMRGFIRITADHSVSERRDLVAAE